MHIVNKCGIVSVTAQHTLMPELFGTFESRFVTLSFRQLDGVILASESHN